MHPKILPAGTKIICPECERVMAISIVDIPAHTAVSASQFQEVEGIVRQREPMVCPHDKTPYFLNGKFYVQDPKGWL